MAIITWGRSSGPRSRLTRGGRLGGIVVRADKRLLAIAPKGLVIDLEDWKP